MMQKLIIRSLLFVVIGALLLVSIEKVLDYGSRNSMFAQYAKVNILANHKADPQIAFFGSSVGEVSLNSNLIEKATGKSAYNFCIDGTRFMQYNGLVKEFNARSVNCELVVFAETFFTLSRIDQLTEVDRFLPYINDDEIYASLYAIQPDLLWKLRYVPFYKFIVMKDGYYKSAFAGFKGLNLSKSDPLKGFTPKQASWDPTLDLTNRNSSPIPIQLDSATLAHYRNTIAELRQKGRKVLIVIPPIQDDGLKLLPDLDKVRKALSDMQTDGVYFKDYSHRDLSTEKNYFYNNSHVNSLGAEKFSSQLATAIDSILVTKL